MLPIYHNLPPLFDLTFRYAALLSLVGIFVNLAILILIVRKVARNLLTTYFILILVTVIVWGIGEFMIRLSRTADTALFWEDVMLIGTIAVPVFLLSFVLIFSKREHLLENLFVQMTLFVPAVWFLFFAWNTDWFIAKIPQEFWWGWYFFPGPLFPVVVFWIEIQVAIAMYLLVRVFLGSTDYNKKMQSGLIFAGLLISVLSGTFFDALLPFWGKEVPGLLIVSTSVANIFFYYAIVKYKLFVVSPSVAMASVVDTMNEALLVFDPEGFIEIVNKATEKLLGYKEKELVGAHVKMLFPRGMAWNHFYARCFAPLIRRSEVANFEIQLLTKDGRLIPVQFSGSVIHSPAREVIGIVGIAGDIREYKKIVEKLENTQEDLQLAKYNLERKIGEMLVK